MDASGPGNDYLSYGPYATNAPVGADILVRISLAVDKVAGTDDVIAELDVHDEATDQVITRRVPRAGTAHAWLRCMV